MGLFTKNNEEETQSVLPLATVKDELLKGARAFTPPVEWRLATGIAYAITGAPAVADTTAVALADVAVSIGYL